MAGTTDLAGTARIVGSAADIGCFELGQDIFAAFATPSATAGLAPFEVSFTVSAYGDGGQGLSCEWDWDGDGTYDETTTTFSASHTYATPGNFSPRVRVTDVASGNIVTDAPGTIQVRSAIIYVDATSTTPSFPYATSGTAATTIAAAIEAAIDGCVIEVAANTYSISTELMLDKGVTLRGATGTPEDVIVANTKRNGNGSRVIFVNSADAHVEGITVHGGYISNNATPFTKNGGGVFVGPCGGTVSNCVIRSCGVWTWGCQGGGLYIHASAANTLVTHCVITNCAPTANTASNGDGGSALAMYAGNVRNCLFAYNRVSASNSSQTHAFGTVLIGGGTLENCTVVKNDSYNCSGVYATGGEVRNCAIGLNTSSLISGNANYVVWAGKAPCFSHCLAPILINADCIQEDESSTYVAAESGDFALTATSDGADAAAAADWMTGATDLAGNPRIRGEAPDIGAYEADADSLSATFSPTGATEGFPPFTAAFSAAVVNAEGAQAFFWDWDGDGVFDEETSSPTASHTFATAGSYVVSLKVRAANGEYVVPGTVRVTVVPRVLYVDPASTSPAEPYDTWGNAATAIQTAVDYAIDGCEIVLAATEHVIRTPVSVAKSVWIHGATGNPADTTVRNAVQSGNGSDGTSTCRIFTLMAAGARLSGLTAANGYIVNNTTEYSRDGGGIYVGGAGSVVSNCVVRDSRAWHWGTRGGGICVASTATGALVTHCVVSNCNNAIDGGGTVSGTGIFLAAGTVRNCLLTHNNPNNRDSHISSYSIYATGGTVENCTVADNVANGPTGIYAGDGASVTNCLIVGNQAATDATAVYGGNATRFARCLGDRVLINGECFQADTAAVFKNFAAGDFRLPANSPAVNKGAHLGWMDGATDLAGKPRLVSKPDIGCYECQSGARTLLIMR
jgi:PKD repeat protein